MREVHIAAVASTTLDLARAAAASKRIDVRTHLEPDVGPIRADPDRLQQIIWKLISNAIKFTPGGGWIDGRLERVSIHAQLA